MKLAVGELKNYLGEKKQKRNKKKSGTGGAWEDGRRSFPAPVSVSIAVVAEEGLTGGAGFGSALGQGARELVGLEAARRVLREGQRRQHATQSAGEGKPSRKLMLMLT